MRKFGVIAPTATGDFGLAAQMRQGRLLIVALTAVILVWGLLAPISSAEVAQGVVISQTGAVAVEHADGGRVEEVVVREGQAVRRGELLARLAPTAVVAAADLSDTRVRELEGRRLRLLAERDGGVLARTSGDPNLTAVLRTEGQLLRSQRRLDGEKQAQLREQIAQTRFELLGLSDQVASVDSQLRLISGELEATRMLLKKGYATVTRVNALEREAHRLDGERAARRASIAQAKARIAELELQALQLRSERHSAVLAELKETRLELAQAQAQSLTDRDARRQLEVRAPVAGRIQELAIRTGGGILSPGETLMRIVPERERLIVEVRVAPEKIDRVAVGQSARILFPAFSASTTPEFAARVTRISPSVQRDDRTGADHYLVACELLSTQLPALRRLRSGMPAEAHISGGSRPALLYFLKPLTDQVRRLFREP